MDTEVKFADEFKKYWNAKGRYLSINNSGRTMANICSWLEKCESVEDIEKYVCTMKTKKESTRRIIVDFLEYLENRIDMNCKCSLFEKRFFDYVIERRLEIAKYLHEPHKNEKIFYVVDRINDAILAKQKISFRIAEYDGNKKKVERNDGKVYVISPYAMYWNEDFYYVVGWSDKHDNISAFRVDRMIEPTVLDDKAVPKPKDFNVSVYAHKVFEMYDGDEVRVKLECRNVLMKYVIDRFGMSVETEPSNGETFICCADVRLSPTFYGWVFGFKGGMKILEPKEAVKEMKEMATEVLDA